MEVIGNEKQTEDSYVEGDGGEVMVEIVGSDVFVDGVSGKREGVYRSGETRDLEGRVLENQDFQVVVDAYPCEQDGRKAEESKVSFTADEQKYVAKNQEIQDGESVTEVPMSRVDVVNDVSCNCGIRASEEVRVKTSIVVIDEKVIKDESVDHASGSNNGKLEVLRTHVEAVLDGESDLGEVEMYPVIDSVPCHPDLLDADSVMVNVAADTALIAPSEFSLIPNNEGSVGENVGLFNSIVADNAIDCGDTDPGHSVDLNHSVSVSDVASRFSGEVASSGSLMGKILGVNAESVSDNDDVVRDMKEGEAVVNETENMLLNSNALLPNVRGNNKVSIQDFDSMEFEAAHGISGVSDIGAERICENFVANEKQETTGVDSNAMLNFKDEDLCFENKNECLKTNSDVEAGGVEQDHLFSNEPSQVASRVNTAEINDDEGVSTGVQCDPDDSQPNAPISICVGDEEILEADSCGYTNKTFDTSDAEVINDQKFAISQVNVLVEYGSCENYKEVDGSDVAEACVSDTVTSNVDVNMSLEVDDNSGKNKRNNVLESHHSENNMENVEEELEVDQIYDGEKEVECREKSDFPTEGPAYENENAKLLVVESVKCESSLRMNQPGYLPPPINEAEFSLSDLVWGKVRSYPWWPGQVFDPADASERAVKYHKKDSYLVAYFGDRTFAWNDASLLKPFSSHFSQIEKQSNSEAFQNAVDCALKEVSRRVELGLACSCVPKDAYEKIKTQFVENTGIREESSLRTGVDQSTKASAFEPDKLLDYVRDLAPRASVGANRLDLVIARAQLSAFCCFKGYRLPIGFPSTGELLGNDAEETSDEMVISHKCKYLPKDSFQSRKERSLTELMGDTAYSPDAEDELAMEHVPRPISLSSSKKRKAVDTIADGSEKRPSIHVAKVTISANQTPKPSFKIGECIRRVACQLTGSTSTVKGLNDETGNDGSQKVYEQSERQSMDVSTDFSLNEMLSQLQLVAQNPKKRHNFLNMVITFFTGFRSSSALGRRGRKKRAAPTVGGSAEDFEFDDVNDSYWTDRIVQNYSEEQLLHNCENGSDNLQVVPFDTEKSMKAVRKSHSRKRFSTQSFATISSELDENVRRKKQESSPAELILNFAQRNCVPSEINLNKMFRRFGPLMESETEVDHESGRAKVIFKRGSDAEVAHDSAEKFNIFGPVLVNYEIGYSPLISVKILPLAASQRCQEDPTLML